MRNFVLFLTSIDNERAHSEGKSTAVVSEPGGACPPTSGCLMADQMKQGCMELEGGGETGNSLYRTLNLSVCVCVCVYTENGPDICWLVLLCHRLLQLLCVYN